jgi:hypothetical protein
MTPSPRGMHSSPGMQAGVPCPAAGGGGQASSPGCATPLQVLLYHPPGPRRAEVRFTRARGHFTDTPGRAAVEAASNVSRRTPLEGPSAVRAGGIR